ncbi:MAG: GNAT family N-acetyltransferase [Candidatus Sumerlaeia bacterium]|nr:GNAT family N-acetyltransferase [Candidatus Sumerlaeia bacterium]
MPTIDHIAPGDAGAKERLERFFRRAPQLHFYSLGDLDDFFWPHTRWFVLREGGSDEAAVLLYTGGALPACLAVHDGAEQPMVELLTAILPELPPRLYWHLSPGLEEAVAQRFRLQSHGSFLKMACAAASLELVSSPGVSPLGPGDFEEVLAFYGEAYPGNWFEPFMLATGSYLGIRESGRLLAVAGVHTVSDRYRIAALGNIATHPEARGRGLATLATSAMCALLRPRVDLIGLNVRESNAAAIRCYSKLGFRPAAFYGEWMAEAQGA